MRISFVPLIFRQFSFHPVYFALSIEFLIGVRLLTLSRQRSLSERNLSIDLLCKPMDCFLYDRDLRHERIKEALFRSNIYQGGDQPVQSSLKLLFN